MKRRGFTLSEILIALAIVGVIAAITLPMASKMRPDANKVLYLNTYDALNSALSGIIVNEKVYPKIQNDLIFSSYPLANTFEAGDIAAGRNKFCRVLSGAFNVLEDVSAIAKDTTNACNNTYKEYNKDSNDFNLSFTNKNGVEFMVTTKASYNTPPDDGRELEYQTDVIIDVNGVGNGNDCLWSEKCKHPDRFSFKISADGEIRATDPAGAFYLATRGSFIQKDIDEDNKIAKDILAKSDPEFPPIVIPTTSDGSSDETPSGEEEKKHPDNWPIPVDDNDNSDDDGNGETDPGTKPSGGGGGGGHVPNEELPTIGPASGNNPDPADNEQKPANKIDHINGNDTRDPGLGIGNTGSGCANLDIYSGLNSGSKP